MKPKRLLLIVMSLLVSGAVAFPDGVRGEDLPDETGIRRILNDEIATGLLKKSPELFLKSYKEDAGIFSFGKGKVDREGYRRILEDHFRDFDPQDVSCEVLYVRPDAGGARAAALFREKGRKRTGESYSDNYRRYYVLVREAGTWKIRLDGYNESLERVTIHGKGH